MDIIITGAGGQLGTDMAQLCADMGHTVHAAERRDLDITDRAAVERYFGRNPCDLLINCAAYNAVDRAEEEWQTAYRVNGLGVRNLVNAVNECNGTIVHYSTDYVFDGLKERPYTLIDSPHPINRYGESKLLGEQYIRDLSQRYFLIRVSWVFGPGKDNFVRKVIEWSRDNDQLRIVNDQISSPTYTQDLAKATLDLVKTGVYGLYHITNSGSCSRYEWAVHILDLLDWKGEVRPVSSEEFPSPARRPGYSVLDNFGSHETFGYSLPDWKDATRRFLLRDGRL